jgi:Holliday junction resolvasome RuvABC endonuclease subunit
MTTIIGVDPSMSSTGIAVWRNGLVSSRTVRTSPREGDVLRWRRVLCEVWSQYDGDRSTLLVVEDLPAAFASSITQGIVARAGLLALLRFGADARMIPLALVHPRTLKAYATGNGNAKKADMFASARGILLDSCANDNEADALWLMAMGLDHYRDGGRNAVVQKSFEALSKVDWPLFTPKGWAKR